VSTQTNVTAKNIVELILIKKSNPPAFLCPDQKVSHIFPFAAKHGSWLLLAVELAIYILKENCGLETFDVTDLKEKLIY
jgi:hypothetical protein